MLFDRDYNRPLRFLLALVISLIITIPILNQSEYVQFIDISITGNVQKHETVFFHGFYELVSFLASPKAGILWILLIAFFLWGFKYKIQALWGLSLVLGGDALNEIIKHLVRRPRPLLHPLADTGYSFPSGHVFSTFLIISVIWLVIIPLIKNQKLRFSAQIVCVLWVIVTMLSRIYLNAHYATDTIGAVVIAYAWLQIAEILYIWIAPKLWKWRLTRRSYL